MELIWRFYKISFRDPDSHTPEQLWARLRGKEVMTLNHHPGGGPIPTDWDYHDPEWSAFQTLGRPLLRDREGGIWFRQKKGAPLIRMDGSQCVVLTRLDFFKGQLVVSLYGNLTIQVF